MLDRRLWVLHHGRMIELAAVDPLANATSPRGSHNVPQPTTTARYSLPPRAAWAYANDTRPLVDSEGGYSDLHDDQHDQAQQPSAAGSAHWDSAGTGKTHRLAQAC